MSGPGSTGQEEKERTQASVKAMAAFYKLLGWITLGVGFGFALTLFTFAAKSTVDTDKIVSLAGGLICLMLTILIFVLAYGLAETLKMLLEIEDDCSRLAKRMTDVADRIEIVPEEAIGGPRIEEVEEPPAE